MEPPDPDTAVDIVGGVAAWMRRNIDPSASLASGAERMAGADSEILIVGFR